MESQDIIMERYNRLIQSRKNAVNKYHASHQEKLKEIARNFYARHKDDETFRERQREIWRNSKRRLREKKQEQNILPA